MREEWLAGLSEGVSYVVTRLDQYRVGSHSVRMCRHADTLFQ